MAAQTKRSVWIRQIQEAQKWRHLRGLAGAVVCETRDLGIKWLCWHPLVFSNEITIDMRYVCPKVVKKMLVQTARSVYWKKWAAKHEREELKEGVWLEPAFAFLRKKVRENWTEKQRNVARKIFLEGGWTQKRVFDIGCSDDSECQACQMEEGTDRIDHCSEWPRSAAGDNRGLQEMGAKGEDVEERVEMAKRHRRASSQ